MTEGDVIAAAEKAAERLSDPSAEWVYEDGTPVDPKNHEVELSVEQIAAAARAFALMKGGEG